MAGSTPAASTINYFSFNRLRTKRAEKAKNIAKVKSFIIIEISKPTLKAEEPASGKTVKYFVSDENIHKDQFRNHMSAATQARKLTRVAALHANARLRVRLVAGSSPGNQLHGSRRTRNDAGQYIHTGTLAASTLLFLFALEIAVFGYLPGAQEQRSARRKAVLKGTDLMTTPITAMSRRLSE